MMIVEQSVLVAQVIVYVEYDLRAFERLAPAETKKRTAVVRTNTYDKARGGKKRSRLR